jgi:hypothetical protein
MALEFDRFTLWENVIYKLNICFVCKDSPILDMMPPGEGPTNILARIAAMADQGVMFCGAQHGTLDRFALIVFPVCFFLFNIIYWTTYLSEAAQNK